MALRSLVEGECGAANPLVQWTSHFAQEKSMLKVVTAGANFNNPRLTLPLSLSRSHRLACDMTD